MVRDAESSSSYPPISNRRPGRPRARGWDTPPPPAPRARPPAAPARRRAARPRGTSPSRPPGPWPRSALAAPRVDEREHLVHARRRRRRRGVDRVHGVPEARVSAQRPRVHLADERVVRTLGAQDAGEERLGGKVGDGDGRRGRLGDGRGRREDSTPLVSLAALTTADWATRSSLSHGGGICTSVMTHSLARSLTPFISATQLSLRRRHEQVNPLPPPQNTFMPHSVALIHGIPAENKMACIAHNLKTTDMGRRPSMLDILPHPKPDIKGYSMVILYNKWDASLFLQLLSLVPTAHAAAA
ncbi:uncharacterized protein MAM_05928 [Metarhizium album ARSEF 1941]|uniref:Uncharacterized protein n=1 Tax=Metarhizium album (strain ARSEF 1941) TaxID=1081103 RepID=A0A0B2WS82_METAS|nr:uncharacterized protein MAM_05928 [Metarhizium album ARSEF 1941]KHN96342.1 hypothetical protein MAM_05928 [Metarhizium album ARSEF 1941]